MQVRSQLIPAKGAKLEGCIATALNVERLNVIVLEQGIKEDELILHAL